MSADARWVAAKERTFFTPTTSFTVTQDGTKAKSCGHGKASYSFAGHQTFTIGPVASYLDVTTSSGGGLLADRGYLVDIDSKTDNGDFGDRLSEPLVNKKTRVHLTVTASAASEQATTELWTLTAHTDCLRTG